MHEAKDEKSFITGPKPWRHRIFLTVEHFYPTFRVIVYFLPDCMCGKYQNLMNVISYLFVFRYVKKQLRLGDSKGNRFTMVLRYAMLRTVC